MGTTNFILSKMASEGMEFSEALSMAGKLGYAEEDPTADVEGYDAGRKVAIMASIASHSRVTFDDVYTEGITKITSTDIRYAKELGCAIKLLGVARIDGGRNRGQGTSHADSGTAIHWRPSMTPLMQFLYTGMQWTTLCSMAGEPESCQPPVRLWEISVILPGIFSSTVAAGLTVPAIKSCPSSRSETLRAAII